MFRNLRLPCVLLAAAAVGLVACQKTGTPADGSQTAPSSEAQKAPGQAADLEDEASREPVTFEGTRVAVIHTANLIGELEPCG